MTPYEQKRLARIERLRARGAARLAASAGAASAAMSAIEGIPAGQPILVGHHSERHHRRDLARHDAAMRKSIDLASEGKDLLRRAASAEENTAISSDDPAAIARLQDKLAKSLAAHETMVRVNRMLRAKKSDEEIATASGLSPASVAELRKPDFVGRTGFAPYELTNSTGRIRATRERIEQLERRARTPARPPVTIGEVTIDEEENRVRLRFPAKPAPAVIRHLQARGFRWCRTAGTWQKFASAAAWLDAEAMATLSNDGVRT